MDREDTPDGLRLFDGSETASFLSRPNRFLVRCELDGRVIRAFLPNPGRLAELLLPGRRLHVVREKAVQPRKTVYTVVAVEREGHPVMLHTHWTNEVAHYLLNRGMIPGLENARVEATEVRMGHSRFDFLLEKEGERVFLEVKSCTLFGKHVAMFPDAVTKRGTRHLRELDSLNQNGTRGAVLFVVHWPHAHIFMPDYHTDLVFSEMLVDVRHRIQIIPIAVNWNSDLSLTRGPKLLSIPWDHIEREAKDRGSYLLILRLSRRRRLRVGKLGPVSFAPGFYIYVGSAMRGLAKRIERHRRQEKQSHWHIDDLRAATEFRSALPIRSSVRLECEIAGALKRIAEWDIPGFGATDCTCRSHLLGMTDDPFYSPTFHNVLQYFRMDRYGAVT